MLLRLKRVSGIGGFLFVRDWFGMFGVGWWFGEVLMWFVGC